jgi:hypothetical protein
MSEDQFKADPQASSADNLSKHAATLVAASAIILPRVPRAGNRSYCAETAWVWQRARLVCSVKNQKP